MAALAHGVALLGTILSNLALVFFFFLFFSFPLILISTFETLPPPSILSPTSPSPQPQNQITILFWRTGSAPLHKAFVACKKLLYGDLEYVLCRWIDSNSLLWDIRGGASPFLSSFLWASAAGEGVLAPGNFPSPVARRRQCPPLMQLPMGGLTMGYLYIHIEEKLVWVFSPKSFPTRSYAMLISISLHCAAISWPPNELNKSMSLEEVATGIARWIVMSEPEHFISDIFHIFENDPEKHRIQ